MWEVDVHRGARIAAAGRGGQILVSEATRALVEYQLPDSLSLLDLGPHRLKDLTHPVAALPASGGRASVHVPSPAVRRCPPKQSARPAHTFIGRQGQIAKIKRRLSNGARLLTLTGPGGTGKPGWRSRSPAKRFPRSKTEPGSSIWPQS